MYEENNVTYRLGINWFDILVKIILLIVFVVILVVLFPKADLDVFYDSIYTNNINTMKEAAKSYYTVDRLPSTVGESTSMSLKEMVDNHMLIRFKDKDEKYCDETSSGVEVTKTSEDSYVSIHSVSLIYFCISPWIPLFLPASVACIVETKGVL